MKWTKEKPTKAGLYWFYSDIADGYANGKKPTPVELYRSFGGLDVLFTGSAEWESLDNHQAYYNNNVWWQGPVIPPAPPAMPKEVTDYVEVSG